MFRLLFTLFAFCICAVVRVFARRQPVAGWRDISAEKIISPYDEIFMNFKNKPILSILHTLFKPWSIVIKASQPSTKKQKKDSAIPAGNFYPID